MYIARPLSYTCTCFCVCFRGPVYLVSGSVCCRRHILPAYRFLAAPWQAPLRFHTHDRQREHHFKWQLIRSCLHFASHYPHRFFFHSAVMSNVKIWRVWLTVWRSFQTTTAKMSSLCESLHLLNDHWLPCCCILIFSPLCCDKWCCGDKPCFDLTCMAEDHFEWQLLRRCLRFVSHHPHSVIISCIVVAYWFFFHSAVTSDTAVTSDV